MWWDGWKGVVVKRNKKIRKLKGKKIEYGGEGGKGVVEKINKKFIKIKMLKIRCYECKK